MNIEHSKFWHFLNKYVNFKMGALAGIVTGSIVFVININFGFWLAIASFSKQFVFNLIMAGYNTRSCEKIARYFSNKSISVVLASLIPTIQAFIILYSVHYFGGTPKPMHSTAWQILPNLIFFFVMALIYRNVLKIINPSIHNLLKVFKLKIIIPTKRKIKNNKIRRTG